MPGTTSEIYPADVRSGALKAIISTIRYSEGVKGLGALFITPDSERYASGEELPKDKIAFRFTPMMQPVEPFALNIGGNSGVRSFSAPFTLQVEMKVPGYLWADTANVHGLILAALFPGGEAEGVLMTALQAAGVSWITPGKSPDWDGPDSIMTATFDVQCFFNG